MTCSSTMNIYIKRHTPFPLFFYFYFFYFVFTRQPQWIYVATFSQMELLKQIVCLLHAVFVQLKLQIMSINNANMNVNSCGMKSWNLKIWPPGINNHLGKILYEQLPVMFLFQGLHILEKIAWYLYKASTKCLKCAWNKLNQG